MDYKYRHRFIRFILFYIPNVAIRRRSTCKHLNETNLNLVYKSFFTRSQSVYRYVYHNSYWSRKYSRNLTKKIFLHLLKVYVVKNMFAKRFSRIYKAERFAGNGSRCAMPSGRWTIDLSRLKGPFASNFSKKTFDLSVQYLSV